MFSVTFDMYLLNWKLRRGKEVVSEGNLSSLKIEVDMRALKSVFFTLTNKKEASLVQQKNISLFLPHKKILRVCFYLHSQDDLFHSMATFALHQFNFAYDLLKSYGHKFPHYCTIIIEC